MSGLAVALALAATGSRLPAQTKATVTNVATIPHEAVPNFFKNPPGIYTGENMGIATNSKGNIYIFHRANETRLFEYTPQGEFIREIGRGIYSHAFAHSVRVDAQDNIWTVDEGTDMLTKFSPEGKVLMTIGRREDPVDMLGNMPGAGPLPRPQREVSLRPPDRRRVRSAGQHLRLRRLLRRPRREVRQERPLREGGRHARQRRTCSSTRRTRSPPTSRATSTSAIAATRACRCSTTISNWKANFTGMGNPWAVCVSGGPGPKNPGKQYLYISNSWQDSAPAAGAEITGEVYKVELDGTIVGKFGRAGKAPGEFATIHQMDCRDPDVIYTAEINNWRSQKILLKPQAMKTTASSEGEPPCHASSLPVWHAAILALSADRSSRSQRSGAQLHRPSTC